MKTSLCTSVRSLCQYMVSNIYWLLFFLGNRLSCSYCSLSEKEVEVRFLTYFSSNGCSFLLFLQNFQGHGFMRPSSVGPPSSSAPNTSQSMQSPSQPWLSSGSQGKPPLPSPSYRTQISTPSLQQRSHIPQQHHSLTTTSQQQQHMSSAQTQQPLPSHQPSDHYGQQFPARIPRSITQQLALQGSANPKPPSLPMVQPNTVQPTTQNRTTNVENDEPGNRILSKRSINELVSQVSNLALCTSFNLKIVHIAFAKLL